MERSLGGGAGKADLLVRAASGQDIILNVVGSQGIVSMNDRRQVTIQKLFWRFITGQAYKASQMCAIKPGGGNGSNWNLLVVIN